MIKSIQNDQKNSSKDPNYQKWRNWRIFSKWWPEEKSRLRAFARMRAKNAFLANCRSNINHEWCKNFLSQNLIWKSFLNSGYIKWSLLRNMKYTVKLWNWAYFFRLLILCSLFLTSFTSQFQNGHIQWKITLENLVVFCSHFLEECISTKSNSAHSLWSFSDIFASFMANICNVSNWLPM